MTHLARPPHVTLADHFADPEASRHPLGALFGALGGGVPAAIVRSVLPSVIPLEYARLLERLDSLAYWRAVLPKPDA